MRESNTYKSDMKNTLTKDENFLKLVIVKYIVFENRL